MFRFLVVVASLLVGSLAQARVDISSIDPYNADDYWVDISHANPYVLADALTRAIEGNLDEVLITETSGFIIAHYKEAQKGSFQLRLEGKNILVPTSSIGQQLLASVSFAATHNPTRLRDIVLESASTGAAKVPLWRLLGNNLGRDGKYADATVPIELVFLQLRSGSAWTRQVISRDLLGYKDVRPDERSVHGIAIDARSEATLSATLDYVAYTALNSADGFRNELTDKYFTKNYSRLRPKMILIEKIQQGILEALKSDETVNPNLVKWITQTVANFLVMKQESIREGDHDLDPENRIYQRQEEIVKEAKLHAQRCGPELKTPKDAAPVIK